MSDLASDAEKSVQNKIALRARLLTKRRSLSDSELTAAAAKIQRQTLALVRDLAPTTIAAYVPVGAEPGGPDLPALLAGALPAGGRLLLPVLLPDNDLDWAAYDGQLDRALRGLREPAGPRLGAEAVQQADLILVPALAVGPGGVRMGRGGGSYDRALGRLGSPGPFTVALLHDGEIVDDVPVEDHDRPVRGVITPTGGLVSYF
ncbi:5-formyltetrahydrofolate cyclo-ligase [Actinoplanes sp. DH11]|uniref:5-formyltetrahydrofolate cyclo-ligase n=1 Tax=Actinoplanes sp. DH11 TaxID=2857011 RepID=UPI001E4B8726|nr:5-formyltetrahydrofolate cyclo-ligase [Actinoplanes sp. DH11]